MKRPHGLSDRIWQELMLCGVPWELREGRRHIKIIVDGRMAGIYPKAGNPNCPGVGDLNIRAQIRREVRRAYERRPQVGDP